MSSAADIYSYEIDESGDTAPANVLRFVGNNKQVLEIGAGPGSISRVMAKSNGCEVTAIERDSRCVEILRTFCKDVIHTNLNEPDWPAALGATKFDAVVIADVLEHLYDPWATLKSAADLLNESGSIVVSIPHVGHATVMACLADNDFEYRDWGLLDRTHIRFFGIKNIQDLFERARLKITEVAFVIVPPEKSEFAERWEQTPQSKRDAFESTEYAHVYQVVLRAEPADRNPDKKNIVLTKQAVGQANKLKYIAFYLPQFHPIPENDAWWGKGFTEWTNATKARPLFDGHYQPHLPNSGFYDLRDRSVQHQQIREAKAHGIDAFCFHYYWFGGRRLLERPVDEFLADKKADIEFCLCWANENWTRAWDASEHQILIEQTYSPKNDIDFIESLLPFFRDRRYLRVDGKPLLVVYRPQQIPDPAATVRRWREFCRGHGIGEIHLVAALTHGNTSFEHFGFDAGVEFPPHNCLVKNYASDLPGIESTTDAIALKFNEIATQYLSHDYRKRRVYRGLFPSWDNTARRKKNPLIVLDGTPDNYERWLTGASEKTVAERDPTDRLVFINAWNEWAEGCHLEADLKYGNDFLDATYRSKRGRPRPNDGFTSNTRLTKRKKRNDRMEDLRLWGHRSLRGHPVAFTVARSVYRALMKPFR